jgi:hypothetical protein
MKKVFLGILKTKKHNLKWKRMHRNMALSESKFLKTLIKVLRKLMDKL